MLALVAESSRSEHFVDLDVHAWQWGALLAVIVVMLGIDLYRHRDDHEPTQAEALRESLAWVALGLSFGAVIWWGFGSDAFTEYISGYLIEKSLSVDNVFVWSMIFTAMAIPLKYQHRVLFWGIFGALALRAIFIMAGIQLITAFWPMLIVFGAFLIYTGIKMIRHTADEGDAPKTTGLDLLKRFMPVSKDFDGHNFFTHIDGKRAATPLFAALVVVEATDVIFAVDSVPAILAVSHEPFLVFSSNAFAILGLRAMYFLLAAAKDQFHYLSHALGFILIFVGIKMSISHWYHVPTWLSLLVIIGLLVGAIIASRYRDPDQLAPLDDVDDHRSGHSHHNH